MNTFAKEDMIKCRYIIDVDVRMAKYSFIPIWGRGFSEISPDSGESHLKQVKHKVVFRTLYS